MSKVKTHYYPNPNPSGTLLDPLEQGTTLFNLQNMLTRTYMLSREHMDVCQLQSPQAERLKYSIACSSVGPKKSFASQSGPRRLC
jgi:hypothetical protein